MAKLDQIEIDDTLYEVVPEIAPLFSASTDYAAGDCVIKDAVLCRFKTAHAAGAWIGTDAEAIEVGKELTGLKQDLEGLDVYTLGLYPQMSVADTAVASFTDGADNIPVKSLTVDVTPVQDLHGYDHPWPGGATDNLLPLKDGTYTIGSVTAVISTGKISLFGTASQQGGRLVALSDNFTLPAGTYHVEQNESTGGDAVLYLNKVSDNTPVNSPTNTTFTLAEDTAVFARINLTSGTNYNGVTLNPMLNTGSTAEQFVPYANICPVSGWTGANVSVNGVNQWDEEWESGVYNTITGEKVANANYIRSKNIIKVIPNATYYLNVPSADNETVLMYYDVNNNYNTQRESKTSSGTFTIPPNIHGLKFYTKESTYNHDISINYPSTDHDYHAYKGNVYSITFPSSAGTVYGGTLDVTSGVLTVTDRYVDLGTLNYTKGGGSYGTYFRVNSASIPSDFGFQSYNYNNPGNLKCSNYVTAPWRDVADETKDKFIALQESYFAIKDNSYANASESDFKTAMSGVQLVYELATPVTYQLDPVAVATILGQNNIFADTGNINELTYRADLKAYIDAHVGS